MKKELTEGNNYSITKSNALIDAGYRLSLTEMQIVLYGISLINPIQSDFPLKYRINIKRFAEMFNRKHGDIYIEVKNAILRRFWERDFSYKNKDGKIVTNRWLTQVVHEDKNGFIQIKFNEEVQPYLHQLKNQFTTYYIDKISNFKSIYSIRFYEYAIMHLNQSKEMKTQFTISVQEIRDRLELENKYSKFSHLKIRVLDKAVKEINELSDITLSYKVYKLGRSVHAIKFTTQKKDLVTLPKQKIEIQKLSTCILEKAKKLVLKADTGWDLYVIEQQFYEHAKKNGVPKNLEGAFIGFVKLKIRQKP